MDLAAAGIEARFSAYVDGLAEVIGHADRVGPLRDYCRGLMTSCERKSVEPMAAVTAPERTAAQHQSLLHFVGEGGWSDETVLAQVQEMVLPSIERHGPVEAWIIDDTSFPKKGTQSVGVARQYCGQLGKKDNCQVAVSLTLANTHASLPVGYRLYLPQVWACDPVRRAKAKVPEEVTFKTKPEIALDLIGSAHEAGLPRAPVLMDAAYGAHSDLRNALTARGLAYVAGILSTMTVWAPGTGPLPARPWSGKGRHTKRLRRDEAHQPVTVEDLAFSLAPQAWRTITWREGTNTLLKSRFARLRIRIAQRDFDRAEPWPEEWLLIEWPKGEAEPTRYWLSSLTNDTSFVRLVALAKLRWRIEHDYHELKQEVGLGHYEGRGWRGFHHHASLCIAAYGFLILERETIPPSRPRSPARLQAPRLPKDYRPRGAADQNRTPRADLDRHNATKADRRPRPTPRPMSMLHTDDQTSTTDTKTTKFMTQ